jgi:SAM-dependent methyltransferase
MHIPEKISAALERIPADGFRKAGDGVVIDYVEPSCEADFYRELFDNSRTDKPELWASKKCGSSDPEQVNPLIKQLVDLLTRIVPPDALVVELGGGVHQRRSGFLSKAFANYVPLDISVSSIAQYAEQFRRIGIACDATHLPFRDGSVDAIFTRTFLEHPRQPEKVLAEIVRVTRPGSIVVHCDAWLCRWWSRYGVVGLKRFRTMTLPEKAIFVASQVSEFPLVRLPPVIVRRVFREFMCRASANDLPYGKLKPNYELLLGCDEDASSSIDPLDVIRFYEANGFQLVTPLSSVGRIFLRSPAVVMRRTS